MYLNYWYCPVHCFYRQYSQGESSPQTPISGTTTSESPIGPPPPFTPNKTQAIYQTWGAGPGAFMLIDASVIQTVMFSYVYIWLKDGREFWGWLNHVDPNFTSGFRWDGSRWVPVRINIRTMDGIARF